MRITRYFGRIGQWAKIQVYPDVTPLPFTHFNKHEKSCQGCTTYRPNDVTGSVLSVSDPSQDNLSDGRVADEDEQCRPQDDVIDLSEPLGRPDRLMGHTYNVKWPESEHALYITVNDILQSGHRRPFEVFINSKNMEHFAWTVALTRMISAVFRRGGDVSFVVEELKAVFDPRGGAWMDGHYIPSILAAIGGILETHMRAIGFWENDKMRLRTDSLVQGVKTAPSRETACPACGQLSLIMMEGCRTCSECGYSKCS